MKTAGETVQAYGALAVKKGNLKTGRLLALAVLAGMFIALAGVGCATSGYLLGGGAGKVVGACVFPAGLAMVVFAGAELFTGNSLMLLGVMSGQLRLSRLLRNWGLAYAGNLLGALLVAYLAYRASALSDGRLNEAMSALCQSKVSMPFFGAFARGVLCNFLVCMAVLMALSAESASGKVMAVFFPIMLFVLCGFEHSVANMYYLPAGMLAGSGATVGDALVYNLLPVTLGNVAGGALVAVLGGCAYAPMKANAA